ncbi:MAG: 23S rRNA (adenine(2030)-N(6))-methyltransferase RlmJ [Pseudomonadales bacterium]|nr:23S rRNA (adenine(2030)-N(6))-methyltransferase RlmJ [Pseudomonadales bacterium]
MLSYRHSFHAGNFADVLKHIVLVEILEHLVKKESAFDYIDTHAGAGLYDLASPQALKLQEYTAGIGQLAADEWPELSQYFEILRSCNTSDVLRYYPGSPKIALALMRPQDKARLFEMHPTDFALLKQSIARDRRVKLLQEDGFKGLLALLPPQSRRGLILIDPSYEIKSDFSQVLETVAQAYKRFAGGIYAIWYPVVERKRIDRLERAFVDSGIKKIQRFELGVRADSEHKGMSAAGMIVINPPWILMEKMTAILARLTEVLARGEGAFFRADQLVGE